MKTLKEEIKGHIRASRVSRKLARSHRNAARKQAGLQRPNHVSALMHTSEHYYRVNVLRPHLRAMNLAQAFIKGKVRCEVEDSSCRKPVDVQLVAFYISSFCLCTANLKAVTNAVETWVHS